MPSPSRSSPLSTLLTYTDNSTRSVPGQQVDTSGTPAVPTSRHAFAVAHLVRGSSANEIIQNVLQLDRAGAERHLSQFAFESDPTFEGPEPWGTATEYGDTELPQARRVEVMREHFADARRVEAIALKAPEDDLLLRELPELTAEQRRDLIQGASPEELERLQRGSVPLRMIEEGRELQRDARVSRALMGWYNPELANADSALLRARYGENFDAALADRPGIDRALGIPPRSSALLSSARTVSRLGYPQQAVPAIPAQARERLAALYPTLQAGELDALQAELGLAEVQLHGWAAEREAELADWLPKLQAWRDEPTLPRADSANRQEIARLLELAWRRGTPRVVTAEGLSIGHELTLDGLELDSIPPLPSNLEHIKLVSLNRCRFTQPPEELLRQCPQLRHLFISETPLEVIPQATTQMHALTRLRLTRNRIVWNDAAQALINGMPSLRELSLSHNPLGRTPELGRLLNLRGALLADAQLVDWPLAALELPQMEMLQLDDNLIRDIPEQVLAPSTAALDRVLRLNRGTRLTGNPLSADALRLVRVYRELRAERGGDFGLGASLYGAVVGAPSGMGRWLIDLVGEQFVARSAQWQALVREPDSRAFFEVIEQLSTARDYRGAGYPGLRERVWKVIGAASENTELRGQLFEQAAHPQTCGDGAAYLFSTLEVSTLVYEASLAGNGEASQASLLKLASGLFRLDEVQKLAYAEIARRSNVDEAEVILRYRTFLADALELPGQPKGMLYTRTAGVSDQTLLQAQTQILALEGSGEMVESIAGREFWKANLLKLPAHAKALEELDTGLQHRMAVLMADAETGDVDQGRYLKLSNKLLLEKEQAVKRLVLQWTREALDAEVEVTEL